MLTLTLLRHAKSRWQEEEPTDFDRPLAPRGIKDAPAIGKFMQNEKIVPSLVLCSPARRARQTLDLILPFLSPRPEIRIDDELYPAAPDDMLECVRAVEGHTHLMLVGHNPGLHALAKRLIGSGDESLIADLAQKLPTGGLVVMTFKGTWPEIRPSSGTMRLFTSPKRLAVDVE